MTRNSERHAVIRHKDNISFQPTFYEMQTMKCIAFGGDAVALEIFPKQRDLVDGQNQRHLWKVEKDELPEDIYLDRD